MIKERLLRLQEVALCLCRKWTRPVTMAGIAGGTVINLCIIPLVKWEIPDLGQGALWIGACAAAFVPRTIEKIQGVAAAD